MENLKRNLSEGEELIHLLFEANPYTTFLIDMQGNILYANPTLQKKLELDLKELKDRNIFDLFTLKSPENIKKVVEKLKNGKIVKNWEVMIAVKGDEARHFEIYAVPLEEGDLQNFLIVARDITERKRMKRRLKELSDITEHSADSIIKTDKQFRITYMNPAAENLYGWKFEEVRGKTPAIFNAAQEASKFQNEIYETVTSGGIYKGTYLNKRKDGSKFYCEMNISPLLNENGETYAFTSSQRDVSPRIKAEKKMKEALLKSDFYKDLLAHDMGNILNNLKSAIQFLEITNSDERKSDEKKEIMRIIKKQIKRGASLISNVQKLSKMESMDIPLKPINIKTLIESACKDIRSRFQNKDLKISIEITRGPYTVKGGDLLLDVFENILINGCIHNDAETIQLWIKASKIRKHGEKFIKIEFKDNGIGIKEERKESIFKRGFKKEKSRGGMGLGLSLAKRIIRKYGGQIRVENRIKGDPTQGSNFIILIEEAKRG